MGAFATAPGTPLARPAEAPMRPEAIRLIALTPLLLFAALHWSALLSHPRTGSMLLVIVLALGAAAGLLAVPGTAPPWARGAIGAAAAVVLLVVALLAAGIPSKFVEPAYWDDLVGGMSQGIGSTPAVRVPYRGVDEWVRIAIMSGGTALVVIAALLAAWPRGGARHGYPIAAAVAIGVLYIVPIVENGPAHPLFGGAVFCLLLAGYLYAERLRSDQIGVAVVGMLVVVCAGAIVAGRLDSGRPWLDYEALAEKLEPTKAEGFSWNHSYGPLDWPRDGREILRIKARTPVYWKAVNLEGFDGTRWMGGMDPRDDRSVDHVDRRWTQTIRVVDRGLRSHEFVGAGDTLRVLPGSSKAALWVPDQTFVSAGSPLAPGDSYAAQVYVPRPTDAQLRKVRSVVPQSPAGDLDMTVPVAREDQQITNPFPPGQPLGAKAVLRFAPYGATDGPGLVWNSGVTLGTGTAVLRHGPYERLYALTQSIVAQSSGPYDATQRILRRVRDGATYDETPPVTRYPLATFLFNEKQGYCQQFSGTMALMLRMAGIPARVASGFTPGSRNARRGDYVVDDTDAHSWVEAFFAPYGWITLDPTPGDSPARSQQTDSGNGGGLGSGAAGNRAGSPQLGQSGDRPFAAGDPGAGLAPAAPGTNWAPIVALALLGLALAGGAAMRWVRRPRFTPTAPEVAELERALFRWGRSPEPAMTLARLESLLGAGAAGAAYVRALGEQRFAGVGDGPTAAQRRALRRELGAGLGLAGRLRGWFALPPRVPSRMRPRGRGVRALHQRH